MLLEATNKLSTSLLVLNKGWVTNFVCWRGIDVEGVLGVESYNSWSGCRMPVYV